MTRAMKRHPENESGSISRKSGATLCVLMVASLTLTAAIVLSIYGGGRLSSTGQVKWDRHVNRDSPYIPLLDSDYDHLGNFEEVYKYGTDPHNPDSDGDGMDDFWEVMYGRRASNSSQWRPDPNDPTDALDNPDGDGIDLDKNGKVDGRSTDVMMFSWSRRSVSLGYRICTISELLSNPNDFKHQLVRVNDTRIVALDNENSRPRKELIFNITDDANISRLQVRVLPGFNRPPFNLSGTDTYFIQGEFIYTSSICELLVGPNEHFTNLMECIYTRDYDNYDHTSNDTDPNMRDSDYDGMDDGWEVFYSAGFLNTSIMPPRWEWVVQLDPTFGGDASGFGNPLVDIDLDGFWNLYEYQNGTDPTDPADHPR